ncbi:MAG: sugar phosphate isomerase/epimerase family protein, partial [Thermoguttaceae bacterium]
MNRAIQADRRRFLQVAAAGAAAWATTPLAGRAAAEKAEAYTVGIYTRPWAAYDYRVAFDAIAEAGFKHAGLMTTKTEGRTLVIQEDTPLDEAAKIGDEAKSRGLSIPSVYGGGIPVEKSLEAGIAGLRRLIDACAAAGARSLLMGGMGNEKLAATYYQAIAECCDYAAEKKLPITVKPHGGLNSTGPQCRQWIEKVGHKNFDLWYDPGNIFFYSKGELDPVDDAATVNGLVRTGMSIKDFAMVERDGKATPDVALTPGTGRVDFPKVLAVLRAGGFT